MAGGSVGALEYEEASQVGWSGCWAISTRRPGSTPCPRRMGLYPLHRLIGQLMEGGMFPLTVAGPSTGNEGVMR